MGVGEVAAGPNPRRILLGVALTTTSCVLPTFLLGAMAVQIRRDLHIDDSGIGLAFALFFASAALSSPVVGGLGERLGPRRAMRTAAVVAALTALAVAVTARSFATLLVPLLIGGATNALCQPASNLLIARAVPPHQQGLAFAVKQSAVPASTLVAGATVPALAVTIGWRWGFVAAAVLALVAAAAVSVPEGQEWAGGTPGRRARGSDVPFRIMVLFAIGLGFGSAAGGTLGTFLVSAAVDGGHSESAAGWMLATGSMLGVTVRLLVGRRADGRAGGHLRIIVGMLLAGAAAFGLLALSSEWRYVVAAHLAFCTAWGWTGLFNLALVRANPTRPAAATGITQTGTYVGAVVGPMLFGAIAQRASYPTAWWVATVSALLAAAMMAAARSSLISWRASAPMPPIVAPPPA